MAATASTEPVVYNPFEPGYPEDPYRQFALLREHDPVHESLAGPWMLFRYEDVNRLLRDSSLSVEEDRSTRVGPRAEIFERVLAESGHGEERRERGSRAMLNLDPPDHTRLRRLVSKAFTPRMIEGLRPLVGRLVDEHLDAVADAGRMDVIADLAFPLPFTVISEMLGMPDADRDQLRDWSHAIVKLLDPVITEEEITEAFESSDLMTDHVHQVIDWKRAHPADDLLTALIRAEEDGDRLTPEELRDQVVLLFIAGHETTVNLIGNGTLALLRHPDQLARWRDDPSLDANAVDELLRYDSPVQFSRRITVAPMEVAGRTVPERTFVLAGLASSNRDPAFWGPTADELDLGRPNAGQHVAFGSGTHFCLGAALARLEGQEALGRLIRRFGDLALADPGPAWNGRLNLRGLERLPVTFTPDPTRRRAAPPRRRTPMTHDPAITPDEKDWTWVLDRPCPDCGFDPSDHPRERLGKAIRRNALRWRPLLDRPLAEQRPRPDQWSALEYGAHVRDVYTICLGRLQKLLAEDDPTFANWDQDATAVEDDYAGQDPFQVARALESAAIAFAEAYDAVEDTQWARTGTRSDGARFTVESFGRYVLHDPMHHVWDVEQGYDALEGRT